MPNTDGYYQPPDPPPECLWCDGQCTVEVATIFDVDGKQHIIGVAFQLIPIKIPCPRCNGTGHEPKRSNDDP